MDGSSTQRARRHHVPSCLLVLIATACGQCGDPAPTREWTPADHGQPALPAASADDGRRAAAEPGTSGADSEERAARALWVAACASCHGREGRGDGAGAPPGARLPDFTIAATLAGKSDAQLAAVIRDGRGMMPAFGKQIVEAGIGLLVRQVRAMSASEAGDVAGTATAPAPAGPAVEAPAPAAAPAPQGGR